MHLSYISSLLLLLALCSSICALITKMECMGINANSNCSCSTVLTDFEITCPSNLQNPKITVRIQPDTHVQIECDQLDAHEYNLLPHMSIGNNPTVQMKYCPLPGHNPIARILDQLGIANVNSLTFKSSNLDINMTRHHLAGLQNLTRLSLQYLEHLPGDLFNDMRNLTSLEISFSNIVLPQNIFANLGNLHFLELEHNHLQYLPPGIFRNQRKLHGLNLWSNRLRYLTKEAFEGVSSIIDLDLTDNGIKRFEPDVFSLLPNLSTINLSGNDFSEMPEGLFANNYNLTVFRLINYGGTLMKLPPALFANKPQLREIHLVCNLELIPDNIFVNSSSITNISLTGINPYPLPENLLWDQTNLLYLDLRRNNLLTLPDKLFRNTSKLIVLKLSRNQLSEISSDVFAPLVNLETLYIDNNRLKIIHPNAFVTTQNLRLLDMANNQIDFSEGLEQLVNRHEQREFGSPFQALFKLETLNLRNNLAMYIFHDWKFNLMQLRKLDLSHNSITTLNDDDLQFLSNNSVEINLSYNKLRNVDFNGIIAQNFSRNGITVTFDLANNPINCDCMLLQFVRFLRQEVGQHLLNEVQLKTDSLVCENPPNLKGKPVREVLPKELLCPFDNENSKQKRCPRDCECWIRSFDLVLMVNCSNLNLNKVPALPCLEPHKLRATELYIENNKLMTLPQSNTPGYADVTKIYAAHNNLTQLEANNLPSELTYLDLRYNKLQALNSSALHYFNISHTLVTLQLSHNPWLCNCENKGLLQYSQRKPRIKDYNEMRCKLPKGEWKAMSELTLSDICPV